MGMFTSDVGFGGSGAASPIVAFTTGFDPSKCIATRRMKARVLSGVSHGTMLFVGDSLALGYGASTTANLQAVNANPANVGRYLRRQGINAGWQNMFGDRGLEGLEKWYGFDARITQGAFSSSGTFISAGGALVHSGGNTTMSFLPEAAEKSSKCDYYYATFGGGGTFTTQVNAEAASGSINTNLANGFAKATATAGADQVNNSYKVNATGDVYLAGMNAYDDAVKQVHCLNMGWFGAKASDYQSTTNPWEPRQCWATFTPDVIVFSIGGNDAISLADIPTLKANIQNMITSAKATGADVFFIIYTPCLVSTITLANQQLYAAAIQAVCTANNVPTLSLFNAWNQDYASYNTAGFYRATDPVHRSQLGERNVGDLLGNMLMAA